MSKDKYGKPIRKLPCKDCGDKVEVSDEAISVICGTCTQKRVQVFADELKQKKEDLEAEEKEFKRRSKKNTGNIEQKGVKKTRIRKFEEG